MDAITLENALRCVNDARAKLRAQYIAAEPWEPGYERACADTLPPEYLRGPLDDLRAAAEHLMNLLDATANHGA